RMGLKSGWFLTVIPYSVSMPMTFGMAMRFLAPWRTETPGPGQGKDEGGAPPPSRSRLQILSGIDDALDAPLLLLGLAHQRLHVDDPLTLLPRDLRPVVGVRGVRQVLVLLELLADGGLEVLGGDALGAAAEPARAEDRRVDEILAVRGADDDHVLEALDAVDLGEELGNDRGLDVGRDPGAARAEEGVHLVEEHDDRHVLVGLFLGLHEDLADLALGFADVLVEELGALDVEEVALDLLPALLGDLLGEVVGHGLGD